ncbi:alkaline D-peptidase [Aspergillus affinis]|uniref:alkaline D-peptidase n=1 Tax=Aspergillus affinis TaxID=1070780 RepID=UPI0022FE7E26|nr:alkaline D-peptidase [Aspergillus affinis]KAI9040333.1 alkaline D-peptidase [Aspergillus affinis]
MSATTLSPTTASPSSTIIPACTTPKPGKNGYLPPEACDVILYYVPSFGAAVFFCVLYGLSMIAHGVQGFMYKKRYTWVIVMGALWELFAFIFRSLQTRQQNNDSWATAHTILFLLAPLWINAFLYMTIGRLIYFFIPDKRLGGITAKRYGQLFVWLDIVAFLVQAVGAVMTSNTQATNAEIMRGVHIYMGGIGLQELFILIFSGLAIHLHRRMLSMDRIRIVFRLAQYADGTNPNNPALTHEWYEYVWDALPMFVAIGLLNIIHPGRVLQGPDSEFPKLSRKEKKQRKRDKKEAKKALKELKTKAKLGNGVEFEQLRSQEEGEFGFHNNDLLESKESKQAQKPCARRRCRRLGKECTYRQAGRRFDGFRKDKQIEALEAKVNELMAYQPPVAGSSDTFHNASSGRPGELTGQGDVIDQGILSMETADYFLEVFKSRMAMHFPFVVIPPGTGSSDLRQKKPFLLLAVLASSTYEDLPLQRRLGRDIKDQIASRMVINGEVSFELLQGLLVYLAWSHFHKKPHRYTQILQLAIGLMIELRLDRPQHTRNAKTALQWKSSNSSDDRIYTRRSLGRDEQRAVAGCYHLSSMSSILLQKPSSFPNISTYLEDCCHSLHEANEYPNDRYIGHITQLQFLTERIDRLAVCYGMNAFKPSSVTDLHVSSLQEDLESFRRRLPFDLHGYPLLAIQFHVAELCLCQLSIGSNSEHPPGLDRQEELTFAGLHAAESLFRMYLSLPSNYGLGLNNSQWIQMGFSLLVACKLVLATAKASPKTGRSQKMQWLETMSRLHDQVGSLSAARVDNDHERDVFYDFSQRVSRVMSWLGKDPQSQGSHPDEAVQRPRNSFSGASIMEAEKLRNADSASSTEPPSFDLGFDMGSDIDLTHDAFFAAALDQMMEMYFSSSSLNLLASLLVLAPSVFSFTPCPLLGPAFPPFKLDPSSKDVSKAIKELKHELDDQIKSGNGSHGITYSNTTSFSLALFSTNEGAGSDGPFFYDYHYTAPSLRQSKHYRAADANSVYRIGGLSQIFTVWTLLATADDGVLDDAVTEYLPELESAKRDAAEHADSFVAWERVTVGQLASHMAGIARDSCISSLNDEITSGAGLPKSPASYTTCTSVSEDDAIARLIQQKPAAFPDSTPLYSNMGFEVLGYVIQNITGQNFEKALQDTILTPLALDDTSLFRPSNSSKGIIPVNKETSGWANEYTGAAPAISMFSSTKDLSLAGKAILNSTLLSHLQTRRWLNPASHTSNPANSLGYPWIIYSSVKYPNTSMVDIYTYYSDVGLYSSYLGIVPDFNIGFAILAADSVASPDLNAHADIIGDIFFEAMMKTSATQAAMNFGGHYRASNNRSSITISADGLPGLFIEDFVSQGADFRKTLASLTGVQDPDDLSIRLYPTGLTLPSESGSRQTFRAIFQDKTELADNGTPTCVSWTDVGKLKFNQASLDEFVFEVNGDGEAIGVEIPALGVTLKKK